MRFFSRRATSSRARPSSRGRRRLLAPCDKSSKEGLGEPCRMHIRLAGCGLPLLRLYHARWQGSWVLTGRAVTRFRFSRALAGITRAGRDRMRLLDSDLAIIPCSARAGNMSSLFTSELRLATLFPAGSENQFNPSGRTFLFTPCPPRAVSIRMAIVETAAGCIRAGCPELYAGDGLSWRRVTYAPGPSHRPSKIARFPRRPAPAPRVGKK